MGFCGEDVLLGHVSFRESYFELLVITHSMHQIRIRRRTVGTAYSTDSLRKPQITTKSGLSIDSILSRFPTKQMHFMSS